MSSNRPRTRYIVLAFFLGGFVFSGLEFLIRYALPCGHHSFFVKECPAPPESLVRRGLNNDGLSFLLTHDKEPLFTFPEPFNSDDTREPGVVTAPVPQDLDTNDDGVPDQPVVFSVPFPSAHNRPSNAQYTPSAMPTPYLWREIDTSSSPTSRKRSLPGAGP